VEVDAARSDRGSVSTSKGSRRRSVVRALPLVVVLALPVLLTGGLWWWQSAQLQSVVDARAEDRAAVNAATALTLAWASVDHREVDDYIESVREGATGPFLEQFGNAEPFLRRTLVDNESVQVPTIPPGGAALLERSGSEARVIVAMDAQVSNKRTDRPQARQYRLQVQLDKADGEWLVSGLEFIDDGA
jgi:Mce-associated membrane protein